jgi:hypothetical protein
MDTADENADANVSVNTNNNANTDDSTDAITIAVNNININGNAEPIVSMGATTGTSMGTTTGTNTGTSMDILIMLDLNGTLVHRSGYVAGQKWKYTLRPYLGLFLGFLFSRYKVGIWTSGTRHGMRGIVRNIFGQYYKQLTYKWYRDRCDLRPTEERPWNTVKDMNKLKGKFKSVIMIDNSNEKMVGLDEDHVQYEVPSFLGNMDDHALLDVMTKLS